MRKMKFKNIFSRIVLPVSAGVVCLAAASSVYAADIGYHRSTSWADPIFNKGEVNALVVRVGFNDHPLDESNPYYRDDLYMRKMFEGAHGGVSSHGYTWDGLDGYLRTSSYGTMSFRIGDIIDLQLEEDLGSYFEDEDYDADPNSEEATAPWSDFFQETLKEKIFSMVDVSDYDEDGDGNIDTLYIFNCAPKRGVSDQVAGFVTDITGENLPGGVNSYMYMSFYDEQTPEEEDELFFVLVHETGHLLFDLDDYYELEGFYSDFYGPGNIMDINLADLDGFSKYLIGWLDDENTISYDPSAEKSGEVSLTPSDSESSEGKKLAFFDYGGGKIAAEYVSLRNNNKTGEKEGFRFYLIGRDGKISKAYCFDDEEYLTSQVVGSGDDMQDLFGLGLDVYDIKTGENPSFSFRSTIAAYDDSEILNIDLSDKKGKEGSVTMKDPASEDEGTKFIFVRDGQKTELICFNPLKEQIDIEIFNTADIYNVLKTDMEYITDGGFLDSSGRLIDMSEVYAGGGTHYLDQEEEFFEILDSDDVVMGFKIVNKSPDEVSLIYKYPADEEWLRSEESGTGVPEEKEEPKEENNKADKEKEESAEENKKSDKENEKSGNEKEQPAEENKKTDKGNEEQEGKAAAGKDGRVQPVKTEDGSSDENTGKSDEKTISKDINTAREIARKGYSPENVTPARVIAANTGDDSSHLMYYITIASASAAIACLAAWRSKKR